MHVCSIPALVCQRINPTGCLSMWLQIYESNICNEFLEDFQPEPSLLPPHPAVRARARIIIARFSEAFVPAFYRLLLRCTACLQRHLFASALHLHVCYPMPRSLSGTYGPKIVVTVLCLASWFNGKKQCEQARQGGAAAGSSDTGH